MKFQRMSSKGIILILAVLLLSFVTTGILGSTYYVDSNSGDDNNDGLTPGTAWKTLSKVSSFTFQPGDRILLKAGSVWNDRLVLHGSGSAENPIILDMYGSGNKPIINGGGGATNEPAVLLENEEYWEINNLEVTHTDGSTGYQGDLWGIRINVNNGTEINHIYIRNCYIHDVNGNVGTKKTGGIYVTAEGSSPAWYNDLRIENNRIANVGGLGIATQSSHASMKSSTRYPFLNVVIRGNVVGPTGRNNVIVRASDNAIVEHNTLMESSRYDTGHSIFCFNSDNVIIQYNEAYGNSGPSSEVDRGGFDADYNCKNTKIQYNYSHDNNWAFGIMKRAINENVVIRYN
ncbi:MAG TPA: hypothetical protein ENK92_03325, partial [Bacteroidetes bacterium]|nr:hypothetical protein [Bacteroidota bacterium]